MAMFQDEDWYPSKYLPPRKIILLVADDAANANKLSHAISRQTAHHVFLTPNSQVVLQTADCAC